ncbi:prefoldin subunit 1 [Chelmon rostratus]|uniref:prefoldin subunit 1 n=1 Tax=Chelmon rostratus TaxID=109905 RepID=UPI001BE904B6|nr:prefoldin subunit 1 [Chelmon rostratus]
MEGSNTLFHAKFVVRRRTPSHLRSVSGCGSLLVKMAAPIDLELKKAFSELQVKMIDTQQKVKLADLQIDQLTRVQKIAKLTHTEITMLPDNTRLYEGVGRMFILQSKEEINNQLTDRHKTADEKIKELEQKKLYLERSVKEAEDNIREMLLSRRAQ